MFIRILIFSLLLAVPCISCGGGQPLEATRTSWPAFRGDAALSGVSPARLPAAPVLRWTFDATDKILASPIIHDGVVYLASRDGKVSALRLSDGQTVWSVVPGADIEASPLVHARRLYVGDLDGKLHALDAATGERVWTYATEGRIMGGANWHAGERPLLLVGSYDNHLHAVDPATGSRLWLYETANYINGTPAVSDGWALIGGCDEKLHVVRLADGQSVAMIDAASYIAASPATRDGFAYIGHYNGEVLGIDLAAKSVIWRFAPETEATQGPAFFASPAVTATRVLAGGRDGGLYCLSRATGEELWRFRARRDIDSSPVVARDKVLFGSRDGRLYMLRFDDGELLWSYLIGSPVDATPAVVDDWIVVGGADATLYAFGEAP